MSRADSPRRDLRRRLAGLAGIAAIVGVTLGVLLAAGLLGSQGGGEGIKDVTLLDTPRDADQADLDVGPQVGKLAPDFELSDFDGTRYRLSGFRGRALYINFWATWCGPCREEMPDIQEVLGRHEGELVVISVNRRQSLDTAQDFFADLERLDGGTGVSFTVNGMDPDDTLYQEYRGLGMPVSVFVDPEGVVSGVYNGRISLETMEEAVGEALSGAAVSS